MTESKRLADQKRRIDMHYGELFAATILLKAIAGRLKGIKLKDTNEGIEFWQACRSMSKNKTTKKRIRRHRRLQNMRVRSKKRGKIVTHNLQSGRTGQVHNKRTKSKESFKYSHSTPKGMLSAFLFCVMSH
jgi:hypothetical protein